MRGNSFIILTSVVLFFSVFIISPMINSGYTNDDSILSFIKGSSIENNVNIIEYVYILVQGWFLSMGRFAPFVILVLLPFLYANLFIYKLIVLSTILINLYLFGLLIKRLTGSASLSLLSILIAPILFQIRPTHDPILGYYIVQLVTMFSLISMNLFVLFKINEKFSYYILSLLFYILGLLTYEITYPFFIFYFILTLGFSWKKIDTIESLKTAIPFLAATIACISLNLILRFVLGWGTNNTRYAFNLALSTYLITVIKQSFAAFPLIYYVVDPENIFNYTTKNLINIISIDSIFIFLFYIFIFTYICILVSKEMSIDDEKSFNINGILILGLSFLILPSVIVSLVPTYQKYLIYWGSGYIPVFISYFGIAFIFIYFILLILSMIRSNRFYIYIILIMALLAASIGTINYNNNNIVIEKSNKYWLYPRALLEESIKNGLSDRIPNNSTLLVDSAKTWDPWDQKAFYLMISGKKFRYVWSSGSPMYAGLIRDKPNNILPKDALIKHYQDHIIYKFLYKNNISYVTYAAKSKDDGYAIFSPSIEDLIISDETIYGATSNYTYIYIKHSNIGLKNRDEHIEIYGYLINNASSSSVPFIIDEDRLNVLSHGKDWILFSLNRGDKLVDLRSISINILQEKREPLIYLNDVYMSYI